MLFPGRRASGTSVSRRITAAAVSGGTGESHVLLRMPAAVLTGGARQCISGVRRVAPNVLTRRWTPVAASAWENSPPPHHYQQAPGGAAKLSRRIPAPRVRTSKELSPTALGGPALGERTGGRCHTPANNVGVDAARRRREQSTGFSCHVGHAGRGACRRTSCTGYVQCRASAAGPTGGA